MSERALPQSGELWQHFKGNKYWIIGIVNESNVFLDNLVENKIVIYTSDWTQILREIFNSKTFLIKDTETEEKYEIDSINYNELAIYPVTETNARQSLGWARNLNNFMNILEDQDQIQKYSKYPRFFKLDI